MSKKLKEKLETIRNLANECLAELGSDTAAKVRPQGNVIANKEDSGTNTVLQIVNKVGDCAEADLIQKRILDQRGAEGRILLSFYISNKYFSNAWLTSGDVSKITSNLGVKIDKKNVTNYLVSYRKYLESNAVRKTGQPTPYRMNRNGVKRFEEIINAKTQ